jgi:hypothetical protein
MIEFIIKIICAIICTLLAFKTGDQNIKYLFLGINIPLYIDCLRMISEYLIKNFSTIKTAVASQTIRRNSKIRISCSYLYRIKINDRYLLVKNSHRVSYQFVGGVYKQNEYSKGFLRNIRYSEDEHLPTTDKCTDDFRIFIHGLNLMKFIKWFNESKDRELSCDREFYEELIKPEILSSKNFPYPRYSFVTQIITPIMWSRYFNCWELQIHDILDLKVTESQSNELIELQKRGDNDYIKWANLDLIKSLGHDRNTRRCDYPIGEHTKWAVNEKYTNN